MRHSDQINVRGEGGKGGREGRALVSLSFPMAVLRSPELILGHSSAPGVPCPGLGHSQVTKEGQKPPQEHFSQLSVTSLVSLAASPHITSLSSQRLQRSVPSATLPTSNFETWGQNLEEIINNYFTGEGSSWSSIWWGNIYLTKACYLSNNP